MDGFILIGFFVVLFIGFSIYDRLQKTKYAEHAWKSEYGQKPNDREHLFTEIGYYWHVIKDQFKENEYVDDVTWNDLEMDHLFTRLNYCISFVGEQVLYGLIHMTQRSKEDIQRVETLAQFMAANESARHDIQKILSEFGRRGVSYFSPQLIQDMEDYIIANTKRYVWLNRIWLATCLIPLLLWNPVYLLIPLGIFIVNIVIYVSVKNKYDSELEVLGEALSVVKIGKRLAKGSSISTEVDQQQFQEAIEPFEKISKKLNKIASRKAMSLSGDMFGLLYDYILGGTLRDFVVYDQIVSCLVEHKQEYLELYQLVGEVDGAISIASFRDSLPLSCVPSFSDELKLEAVELYHPMIDEAVANTIELNKNCIITGSNASGKSTYIKALMINMILGQSINTCTAEQVLLPRAHVITSMAVRDDLMSSESYYIKEIKYLNRILQQLDGDRGIICAIDEILKGTNTEERIAASLSVLDYLETRDCLVLVASHDIEIAETLDGTFLNYHFKDQIMEHDILFDYKINHGISRTKNAIRLLEYVGFPNEIIDDANNYINGQLKQ